MKGNFDMLVDQWKELLVRHGSFFNKAWNLANDSFDRYDVPGGCPLSNHQSIDINDNIKAFVQGKGGGSAWDNYIEFAPTTRLSKAARIAAKRLLVPDVPEIWFDRSIKTRFGWEVIQMIGPFKEQLEGVVLRPRLTKYGCLSNHYFQEWAKELTGKEINNLSGPRQETFLRIALGEDWKKLFPIK